METIDRRTALVGAGVAAVALAGGIHQAVAQQPGTSLNPVQREGVETKILNEGPSMIPGYKKVRLLDIVVQPGKSFGPNKMETPMVCHMLEGEMDITQNPGGTFTAKKNHVWTCNTGITEGGVNKGASAAIMRVTFLLPT